MKPSRPVEDQPPKLPRKARQLTDAEKGRFVDRYQASVLVSEIAAELGVHRTTLDNLVIRLQLTRSDPRAVPDDVVAAVVQSYRAGQTLTAIGLELGFSAKKVQRLLEAAGEPIRPRGPKSQPLTPEQGNQVLELYDDGWSIAGIASKLGVSYAIVRKHLVRAGVERRPRGGARA
ncbi:helix-turn-helix domain-containing protein [Microbacterium sp. P06]|uniref:helix-turn-helix domain-containing protein n=1 Tax=Microbacterium sp. P06 TaxID=3366949 RepID=UPI003744C6D4